MKDLNILAEDGKKTIAKFLSEVADAMALLKARLEEVSFRCLCIVARTRLVPNRCRRCEHTRRCCDW